MKTQSKFQTFLAALSLLVWLCASTLTFAQPSPLQDVQDSRKKADKLESQGDYKEAYAIYQKLLQKTNDTRSYKDLKNGMDCLRRLNRITEVDALLETSVKHLNTNPPALLSAAQIYAYSINHSGFIIAGTFKRGNNRGGGQYADALERDRIRSIQLALAALKLPNLTAPLKEQAYRIIASSLILNRQGTSAWKLQKLTDLTTLPDYEKGYRWQRGGRNPLGAPVDASGNPLFYKLPTSWGDAKNDGERYRFALQQANLSTPDNYNLAWADFLRQQFGVTTMASYGWFRNIGAIGGSSTNAKETSGILQLHTLKENETIAKLASGVKRFTLPDDQNFIALYRALSTKQPRTADTLIRIFLDRRQHSAAVKLLEETIERFPNNNDSSLKSRKNLLKQITGDWGKFDGQSGAFAVGSEPTIDYTFRNATSLTLTVRPIDTNALINNLWGYLKDNPRKLKWEIVQLYNLPDQLVNGSRKKYVGKEIARRTYKLNPPTEAWQRHWDARAHLSVPVKKPGAYLISALLENGETSHTVVWMDALTLVRKDVKAGSLYYVTDALTGAPVPSAKLEFFGYRQQYRKKPGMLRKYDILTEELTKTTGKDGTVLLKNKELASNFQWQVRATVGENSHSSALLGFTRIYSNFNRYSTFSGQKSFGITDRPVYQPKQKVFGKFWIRQARYDLKDISTYAGQKFTLTIRDAMGNEVVKKQALTADSYGGLEYSYSLPSDAKLGQYNVQIRQKNRRVASHNFRVEEYKKPEYEVSVVAPTDPVMLGESFKATVKATYYHGAPVTEAKVHVKVMRTRHNELWFPVGRWDWLYGGGYGWLDIERPWYPGWKSWGCFCPRPFWWNRGGEQPEIVLERELEIGPDGTVKVDIDTALAKAVHSDTDHTYTITAEVVDASRRTIVGSGKVIAARKAFTTTVWLNRGYAHTGDPILATVATSTADGKPVETKGEFTLYQIVSKDSKDGKSREVSEKEIQRWDTQTGHQSGDESAGDNGELKFKATRPGQYRLSAKMTDAKGHTIEGAILFTVRGKATATENKADSATFTYSDLELIPDKRTYAAGDTVKLLINTQRPNSTVLLSIRGGETYRFVHIQGKSSIVELPVTQKDMPNFFVEAATVSNAQVHTAVREFIVPPEKRILNVEVLPSAPRVKPQAKGSIKVRITDQFGEPVKGQVALTIYDKSLEYISGGSNVGSIKDAFWKWRRYFRGGFTHSLNHHAGNVLKKGTPSMQILGAFGYSLADKEKSDTFGGGVNRSSRSKSHVMRKSNSAGMLSAAPQAMPAPAMEMAMDDGLSGAGDKESETGKSAPSTKVTVRKDFADLIKWIGSVETDDDGTATVPVTFPDNLTTWKIKTWAMAHGTRVGEGSAEVITSKDLIIRLQAPRYFIESDEVTLSAIVHNNHKTAQEASISLELEGGTLTLLNSNSSATQKRNIPSKGETRIDWRCKVTQEGEAIVRMKVITGTDSDAMETTFPVYVHGILKQEAWSRVISPENTTTKLTIKVPAERKPDQTRLEIRYSPTIAGSIVDALPYLVEYPYGCTEQTLNRFVPTVIAQKLIREMGIDLEDVRNKRTNLNPQEIGDDKTRMAQWKRWQRNPVFSVKEVTKMTAQGVEKLAEMQLSDGGWGWFSGYGERSYPHTTAVVVHGLLIAKKNGATIPDGMISKSVTWLKNYEAAQTERIRMWEKRKQKTKPFADALDALVRLTLAEAHTGNAEMLGFLFRDKNHLSVYAKSLAGMAAHLAEDTQKRDAIIRNIRQYLVYDAENQSAHLKLGNSSYWWSWYGSEIEAHAWFLKLLAATDPKSKETRGLVKYLINNRKHATYWNSTRDTAYCIEAIADYMRASGENTPDTTVTVLVDGKEVKSIKINKENLFSFDNKVVIAGDALGTGEHQIEIRKTGDTPVYTNAYLTVFTKESFIKKAGLEVKVDRAYYKLERIDATEDTAGTSGQVVSHKVEKYKRIPLKPGDTLTSGDLVEVELHFHSKNDYEYLMFNDWKPAGFESVELRSGYTRNGLGAYMENHHEKTSFFVRQLARGESSLSYRLRAEIPGKFSALPTQAEAMYAPELRANSDEMKINVKDQ